MQKERLIENVHAQTAFTKARPTMLNHDLTEGFIPERMGVEANEALKAYGDIKKPSEQDKLWTLEELADVVIFGYKYLRDEATLNLCLSYLEEFETYMNIKPEEPQTGWSKKSSPDNDFVHRDTFWETVFIPMASLPPKIRKLEESRQYDWRKRMDEIMNGNNGKKRQAPLHKIASGYIEQLDAIWRMKLYVSDLDDISRYLVQQQNGDFLFKDESDEEEPEFERNIIAAQTAIIIYHCNQAAKLLGADEVLFNKIIHGKISSNEIRFKVDFFQDGIEYLVGYHASRIAFKPIDKRMEALKKIDDTQLRKKVVQFLLRWGYPLEMNPEFEEDETYQKLRKKSKIMKLMLKDKFKSG